MKNLTGRPPDIPRLVLLLVRTRLARGRAGVKLRLAAFAAFVVAALALAALRHDPPIHMLPRPPQPPRGAWMPSIVSNGTGWAVAWVQYRRGQTVVLARLALDGERIGYTTDVTNEYSDRRRDPRVAWNGRGYAVAWIEADEASPDGLLRGRVAQVTRDGRRLGEPLRLPDATGYAAGPAITWSGRAWDVAWQAVARRDDGYAHEQRVASVDTRGVLVGAPRVLRRDAPTLRSTELASSDSGLGVLTSARVIDGAPHGLGLVRLRPDGTERDEVPLWRDHVDEAAIASAGDAYAVAWVQLQTPDAWPQRAALALAVVARDDTTARPHTIAAPGPGTARPALAWNGEAFGVVWDAAPRDGAPHEVYFVLVRGDGGAQGPPLRVSDEGVESWDPTIAWSGDRWGVVWCATQHPPGVRARFAPIDERGAQVGTRVWVSDPS